MSGCDKKSAPPPPPAQVGFITIRPQPVSWTTQLPGRTDSEMTADVRPQVSGLILKRLFTAGDEVSAGQQLYQIDADKPLAAAQAISQQDYDNASVGAAEAIAQVASARASVEQAQINLNYTNVRGPISGHIGASSVMSKNHRRCDCSFSRVLPMAI